MAHIGYFPPEDFAVRKIDPGDMLVRSLLVAAVFLSLWFSFHPFASLAVPLDVTEEGDLANQFGYSALFVLLAAWCLLHQPSRLLFLLRPVLIVTLLWFALSVVTSWDPSLSARRLAFALITIGIAAMVLLLPKNPRHFSDVMAAVVLIVLVACYLGVIFMPSLSIHQATDALEPELAGDWRGVFGHKNEASAVMVLFVFIGFFVARMRSFGLGALIVALALPFLYFTNSRTAMAAMLLAYIMSVIFAHTRRPALGIALSLSLS
ncbi:MAG TPA: hypothetical protein VMR17_10750, partial [Xanthobacteraceae bacterium]|nr:hypothetical protein [Xanthobacteraceae bacterium]